VAVFPNLPTDNLYKFCAITGLVIMGAAAYFPVAPFTTDLRKKRIEWEGAFQEHIGRGQILLATINDKEKEFAAAGKTRESPEWKAEGENFQNLFDKEAKAILDLFREGAKADIDVDNANLLSRAAIGAFIVGLGIAIYGFRNWRLIQLLQDRVLRTEADKIHRFEGSR
jgi:hypothetical protein